jgi:isobutyryl-CoA dehydrogenase
MATFDMFSSYCLTEPNSGSDAANMKTTAKLDGDDFVLNGSKVFISNARESDVFIVMCKTGPKEISTILVDKDTKGLSFGKIEEKMGWRSSPTSMVNFDDLRVPKRNLIFKQGEGFKIAMKALDGGRINIASTSLGAATYAMEKTIDHLKTRK